MALQRCFSAVLGVCSNRPDLFLLLSRKILDVVMWNPLVAALDIAAISRSRDHLVKYFLLGVGGHGRVVTHMVSFISWIFFNLDIRSVKDAVDDLASLEGVSGGACRDLVLHE